jgi:hypothetical protein
MISAEEKFELKREDGTGGWTKLQREQLHHLYFASVLLGRINQGISDGFDIQHAGGSEPCIQYFSRTA